MSNPPPAGKVRVISLWQPYASLMACGAKHLETRGWGTKVRGEIYIHASVTKDGIKAVIDESQANQAGWDRAVKMQEALGIPIGLWGHKLPFGKIIARGELVHSGDAAQGLAVWPGQAPFGDFAQGRFAHHYSDLTKIEPIPYRGSQGFFFAALP